jgi:O-antigen/teichoic acid export membrane protein
MSEMPDAATSPHHPALRRLRSNLVSTYGVYALAVVSGVVVTPIVFDALGREAYGVWAFILSSVFLLGLLDLGVGPSIVRFTAEARGRGADAEIDALASAGLAVYLTIGTVSVAIGAAFVAVLPYLIDMPDGLVEQARIAAALVVAGLALRLPLGLFGNLLVGRQRTDLVNLGNIASTALYALLAAVLMSLDGDIVTIASIALAATVVRLGVPLLVLRRELPELRVRPRHVSRENVTALLRFSVPNFAIHVAAKVGFSTDLIVAGIVLGAGEAGVYAIPAALFGIATGLATAGPALLYPAFAELHGAGDAKRQSALAAGAIRISVALVALVALPLILIPDALIRSWIGSSLPGSVAVASILGIVMVVHQPGFVLSQLLMARGAQARLAIVMLAAVAVNVVLSLTLAATVGLWGVAAATLIADSAASLVAVPLLVRHELGIPLRVLAVAAARPLAPAVLVGVPVLAGLSHVMDPESLIELAVVGMAWVVLGGLAIWRFGFAPGERVAVRARLLARRRGSALAAA